MKNKKLGIPVNIIDNLFDDFIFSIISLLPSFVLLIFILISRNTFALVIILFILFAFVFTITIGVTNFYLNSSVLVNKNSISFKKYNKKYIVLNFDTIQDIKIIKHELGSNTFYDIFFSYNSINGNINSIKQFRVRLMKYNFKNADYYFELFFSNINLPDKWKTPVWRER